MTSFIKSTTGEVVQHFDSNGQLIKQEFIAGDPVEYTDAEDNIISPPTHEKYAGFDMIQPE